MIWNLVVAIWRTIFPGYWFDKFENETNEYRKPIAIKLTISYPIIGKIQEFYFPMGPIIWMTLLVPMYTNYFMGRL